MIKGVVEFGDLKRFTSDLEKLDTGKLSEYLAKKTAAELLRQVKSATPRVTGTLLRNWDVSTNTAPAVRKVGNVYEVTLKNNTEYANYVEYGHRQEPGRYVARINKRLVRSWVPGKHFVLKGEIRTRQKLARVIDAEVERYIKKEVKL